MLAPHIEKKRLKAQRRQQMTMQGIPPGADPATLAEIMKCRAEKRRQRSLGRQQDEMERQYQKLSTRELLDMFQQYRWGSGSRFFSDEEMQTTMNTLEWWAIKRVLDTRPHVPNKVEARMKRQHLAARQHGQGKSQNR